MNAPTYIEVARIGPWRIVRHAGNRRLYVAWYDAAGRQTRRRSLGTADIAKAIALVTSLVDRKIEGDPTDALQRKPIATVREVLDTHLSHVKTLASAEAEEIAIKAMLNSILADRRLASLVRSDFDALKNVWLTTGIVIATVSRRLSTLRSAVSRAVEERLLPPEHAPKIPEYRTKNHVRAAPPKGEVCSPELLARLYDAIVEPHLLVLWVLLLATASRDGALFDLKGEQIDWEHDLIDLNPKGRVQTKKYRPILPIIPAFQAWAELFPQGHVIQWRGQPLASAKTGVRRAVQDAGLPKTVNPYSARHSLGRFLRSHGVSTEEIAVWLGHIAPPDNPATTLLYSPYGPSYLENAAAATEKFFREIASYASTPLLEPPPSVVAYFKRLRWEEEMASKVETTGTGDKT